MTAYERDFALNHSYKQLYMILDNGTLTFSADPHEVCTSDVPVGVLLLYWDTYRA